MARRVHPQTFVRASVEWRMHDSDEEAVCVCDVLSEKNAVEAAFWEEELLGHCLGTSFRR